MSRILLRRGNKVDLPVLNAGEPGFSMDTKELFIGHSSGNQRIPIVPPLSAAPWVAPTLLNSWLNFAAGSPCGYFKDDLNIVHLRGFLKSGVLNQNMFVLPPGYRPAITLVVVAVSNNGTSDTISRFDVATDGAIVPRTGANSFFAIDGVSFRAEQ